MIIVMKRSLPLFATLLFFVIFIGCFEAKAQRAFTERATGSGGPLMPEQAAYDVKHYDLALKVDVDQKSIAGTLTVRALIVKPLNKFVLDLDKSMTVDSIRSGGRELKFERTEKQIWIELPKPAKPGQNVEIAVAYHGTPKPAPHPPWVGGFVWAKSKDGSPWFATAVQMDGADLWFPVKDHPSDKPETASLHFTIPKALVAASNGKLQSVKDNGDGTHTYNWYVSQPIPNYCIALNVGPFKLVKDTVPTVAGGTIPVWFYVLPESESKLPPLMAQFKEMHKFFEDYLGPYPFRADKIGFVETPHLGMEHQTMVAYGKNFKNNDHGFDDLLFHEYGHEWWANLVTGYDWSDFWLQEGFQSYMDTLYLERIKNKDTYLKSMMARQRSFNNVRAVAPIEPTDTVGMYFLPPERLKGDNDIYGKGAYILHTLRYYLGDETFFKVLRRQAYPDPKMEKVTNGKQTRITTTQDFITLVNKISGKDMQWFFDVYVRQPHLPTLAYQVRGNEMTLQWNTPNNLPFPMPVEIEVGGQIRHVEMPGGKGTLQVPADAKIKVDPNGWVLQTR